MKEQKMVNEIKKCYEPLILKDECSECIQGKTKKCDLAIKYHDRKYYLEVKANNKNNACNYAKQMMTECLYNRKYHNCENEYGILLECNSEEQKCELLDKIIRHVCKKDWIAFGKKFKCTVIFLFDTVNEELYFMKWKKAYEYKKCNLLEKVEKDLSQVK